MSVFGEDDSHQLFRAFRTILEMLSDRNYFVDERYKNAVSDYDFFVESFEDEINDPNNLPTVFENESKDKILIYFHIGKKFAKTNCQELLTRITNEGAKHIILVLSNQFLNSNFKKQMANFEVRYIMEYFTLESLLFNVTRHQLVPKHVLLTEEEKNTLLERYSINSSQLPKILVTDPICKYFGAIPGQVFEIHRNPETSGRYTAYRIVD